ncbi:AraC family transcriptional regulator [Devosia beringensis]|uniref:AraC family transcriptional regulator n=1 Tax=Devosia beringensis TaxID=2657486 RepID=UPI00186BA0EA|nr:AraC family transcriptional regulator [Devosia beringensis]
MIDPFAEVVALLQPSLPFSKATSGSGTWRIEGRGNGVPLFCVLLEGSLQMTINGQEPMTLEENDFILVPATESFTTSNTGPDAGGGFGPTRTTQLTDEFRHGDPDGPPNMRALVGHLQFGSPDAGLLLALLPSIIHVRGLKRLATMVQLIRNEAQDTRPARDMIIEHLLQVLLIEALRSASDSIASPGLLRGLADARLATAIRLMHQAPERDWTIEQLANEAALSRSVFFDRFRREVGIAPMGYLQSWRMAMAKNLLRRREGGIKEIAQRVGYGSASAFSVAFTRLVGMPPTQYARETGA